MTKQFGHDDNTLPHWKNVQTKFWKKVCDFSFPLPQFWTMSKIGSFFSEKPSLTWLSVTTLVEQNQITRSKASTVPYPSYRIKEKKLWLVDGTQTRLSLTRKITRRAWKGYKGPDGAKLRIKKRSVLSKPKIDSLHLAGSENVLCVCVFYLTPTLKVALKSPSKNGFETGEIFPHISRH